MSNLEIISKINELKKKRNAVILVHAYQPAEIQDIADFVGDSLGLSEQAANTKADVIVFCGVDFMAETAAILSPDKKVLLPAIDATCPMADMISLKDLKDLKKKHPDRTVVSYVNTKADIKAQTDICCTSANALKVIKNIKNKKILFTPDKYLGGYIASQLKDKDILLYDGYCPVHAKILDVHIKEMKEKFKDAIVLVHPECSKDVIDLADQVLSTTGMFNFIKSSKNKKFIVGTEVGIIHWLKKHNPGKEIYPATEVAICVNMKKNSLEKVLWVLETLENRITVDENIRVKAIKAIEKMMEHTRED